jgi:glycosyltransferase involved in cell wall biosynthesis
VTVLTTGTVSREEKDGPIRVIRIHAPMKAKSITGYLNVWVRLLIGGMKLPPRDLVVTMTDPPMLVLAGQWIAHIKKSRHINWCHDLYPDLLPTMGLNLPDFMLRFLRRRSRQAMRECDRIVVIGRCMARQLSQSGIDPRRITVIPNWPDYELTGQLAPVLEFRQGPLNLKNGFRSVNGSDRRRRKRKDTDDTSARPFEELFRDGDNPKFRILYSGNLGRAHPIATVLDAAEILNRDNPEIEFVFVGDGPGQDRLAQERARRGLENIRFLPYQPASRLRELMESGDVHLISMKHEAAGLLVPSKLYSALAVERPCIFIGPAQSEIAKVINDFSAGTVVPQGESDALARAIVSFRDSSDTWYSAHQGAAQAGRVFIPGESIAAWIKRARDTLGLPSAEEKRP